MRVERMILFIVIVLMSACQLPAEKRAKKVEQRISDNTELQVVDTNHAAESNLPTETIPVEEKIKNPRGIYQVHLPLDSIEHTVAFYTNNTYQLQEKYKNDSVVITTGTWAPSNGYIWLYKDQVVRARYKWLDNELQYFSPVLKKNWGMRHLQDIMQTKTWQNKKGEGLIVFAMGNEPSWNASVSDKDSISLQLPEWDNALRLKITSSDNNKDSVVYTAQNDSTSVRLVVYPFFCKDGMSDMIYKNKVRVHYNNRTLVGCGATFQ